MKHKGGQLMKLPDGKKIKSLFHYCQVRGVLAGVSFTSQVSDSVTVVNNSYKSR